jgi:hypothetical protein
MIQNKKTINKEDGSMSKLSQRFFLLLPCLIFANCDGVADIALPEGAEPQKIMTVTTLTRQATAVSNYGPGGEQGNQWSDFGNNMYGQTAIYGVYDTGASSYSGSGQKHAYIGSVNPGNYKQFSGTYTGTPQGYNYNMPTGSQGCVRKCYDICDNPSGQGERTGGAYNGDYNSWSTQDHLNELNTMINGANEAGGSGIVHEIQ